MEKGVFYLIRATTANRSSFAAIRIAVDMAKNKLISEQEAIMRFDPFQLQQLIEPVIEPTLGIHAHPIMRAFMRQISSAMITRKARRSGFLS